MFATAFCVERAVRILVIKTPPVAPVRRAAAIPVPAVALRTLKSDLSSLAFIAASDVDMCMVHLTLPITNSPFAPVRVIEELMVCDAVQAPLEFLTVIVAPETPSVITLKSPWKKVTVETVKLGGIRFNAPPAPPPEPAVAVNVHVEEGHVAVIAFVTFIVVAFPTGEPLE